MNEMDVFRIEDNRTSPPTVKEYEVVDSAAREDISEIKTDFLQSLIYDTASGSVAAFADGAHGLPCKSVVAQIVPVQSGSGDPSPDNVRPISGWDAVNVVGCGKNLFDISKDISANNFYYGSDGTTTISNNYRTSEWIKVKPNTSYFWAINGVPPTAGIGMHNAPRVAFFDADRNWLMSGGVLGQRGSASVSPSNAVWARVPVYIKPSVPTAMFVEGTQIPSTYEPYTGSTYPVTLPQTVYGGEVDVVSGELTVDRAMIALKDLPTNRWNKLASGTGAFYMSRESAFPDGIEYPLTAGRYPISDAYAYQAGGAMANGCMCVSDALYIVDDRFSTLSDWISYVTTCDTRVIYPLAEPQSYQLTPTEIPTLYSSNTVYADSGDVAVEYPADTKLYISRLTEPDSEDMIADANIVSGKYFMVGNDLYLATANIANGGAIVPGTNCTKVSLATALNTINS